ncbi:uncharacterized protein B0H18DRAFT_991137 [Fomitopsis serialis]|uniref:uncharacterized protein n=1 Tax=Fomitopsis serialis TaxID=139415 RepID=UPI0020081EE3|nr:uncharacterized protein B0H18DRAFT_991137 [Neoantrodia serialis]KAH9931319.1 hypothetical protein B0H18DRAFT_991137 [Neoantrodia serialis]
MLKSSPPMKHHKSNFVRSLDVGLWCRPSFTTQSPFLGTLFGFNSACLSGECSYDVGRRASTLVGILDCDADSTVQDIRVVCADPSASCEHLFQGGAVGTIVRLPENCTTMPFARRFYTRGASTNVKGISLDTNFSAIDVSQNGNVTRRTVGIEDNITSFNHTQTSDVATITFDNQTILLDTTAPAISVGGDSATGDIQIAVTPHVDITIQYGVGAAGTIVPPKLTEFGLVTYVNGKLDGTLQLNTNVSGTFTTGSIPLFQIGIPGLDIPGILKIGPTFQINAKATATVDVGVGLDVGFDFSADNLELYFPPKSIYSSGTSRMDRTVSTAQVNLLGPPDVASNSTLTLDLIPGISFGINALDGISAASVNLNLDNFIEVDLVLDNDGSSVVASNATSDSTGSAVAGSVNVEGGFNVVASADASLFGLLDDSESVTLFSKTFELYHDDF